MHLWDESGCFNIPFPSSTGVCQKNEEVFRSATPCPPTQGLQPWDILHTGYEQD